MADFLDRFPLPFEPAPVAECPACGYAIYSGEAVTRYHNGDRTHEACEKEYVENELGIERGYA